MLQSSGPAPLGKRKTCVLRPPARYNDAW